MGVLLFIDCYGFCVKYRYLLRSSKNVHKETKTNGKKVILNKCYNMTLQLRVKSMLYKQYRKDLKSIIGIICT